MFRLLFSTNPNLVYLTPLS